MRCSTCGALRTSSRPGTAAAASGTCSTHSSPAARVTAFDPTPLTVQFGCEITGFDPSPYLGPKESRRIDRTTQLGFAAASDALTSAGDLDADAEEFIMSWAREHPADHELDLVVHLTTPGPVGLAAAATSCR